MTETNGRSGGEGAGFLPSPIRQLGVIGAAPREIPWLGAFLPEAGRIVRLRAGRPPDVDAVAGWGNKASGRKAAALAQRLGVPLLRLEDGFLRSLGLGKSGDPPLSLVVDDLGIYYDARGPSRLERLISAPPVAEDVARARSAIDEICRQRLSKYNHARELEAADLSAIGAPRSFVLVVDQTMGDASIGGGLADESSFARMLDAAIAENPGKAIVVKTHPDVAAGKARGYLAELAAAKRIPVLAGDLNPISVLERATRVYVVTSQLGFEACMLGLEVRCFGLPFYAGWGATLDEIASPRRGTPRSIEEIFAAAYIGYARYVCPYRRAPSTLEATIETLARLKRENDRNSGLVVAVGFRRWKRAHVAPFLRSTRGRVEFCRRADRALARAAAEGGRVLVWAAREPEGLADDAARMGVPLLRMEDGFIRSVGLGSDLVPAMSLNIDGRGIHFDQSRPSDLEHLLETHSFTSAELRRAAALRERLVASGITKYNVDRGRPGTGAASLFAGAGRRTRVLVPGQVENDASILRGSPVIRSNLELLRRVRERRPDAFIVYRPHPDVVAGNRPGHVELEDLGMVDAVAEGGAIAAAIMAADEVHTMTSQAGFEALLLGRRVFTYGMPFYAGWGLTEDLLTCPRRTKRLILDELVAGALLLYPRYIDPVTGLPATAELVVERILSMPPPSPGSRGLLRQLRRLARGLDFGLRQAF